MLDVLDTVGRASARMDFSFCSGILQGAYPHQQVFLLCRVILRCLPLEATQRDAHTVEMLLSLIRLHDSHVQHDPDAEELDPCALLLRCVCPHGVLCSRLSQLMRTTPRWRQPEQKGAGTRGAGPRCVGSSLLKSGETRELHVQ